MKNRLLAVLLTSILIITPVGAVELFESVDSGTAAGTENLVFEEETNTFSRQDTVGESAALTDNLFIALDSDYAEPYYEESYDVIISNTEPSDDNIDDVYDPSDLISYEMNGTLSSQEAVVPNEFFIDAPILDCFSDEAMQLDIFGSEENICLEAPVGASGEIEINETNFPDEIFRKYVSDNFDKDGNKELSQIEANDVDEIEMQESGVGSLAGVEYFNNLKTLFCSGNLLTSLDLSGCSSLEVLVCFDNQLTDLNLSGCSGLSRLYCHNNQLTGLNLSDCSSLRFLECIYNQLTSLNLSCCPDLESVACHHNKITSLNLSGCQGLKSLECYENKLTSLNLSGCSSLEVLQCYGNQLTSLNLNDCPNLLACLNLGSFTDEYGYDCYIYGYYELSRDHIITQTSIAKAKVTLSKASFTYTGNNQKPTIKSVVLDGKTLKSGTDYTVSFPGTSKAVKTYTITVTGKGAYKDTVKAAYKIVKANNPITAKVTTKTVKLANVKKKAQIVAGAITVSKAKGKVSYAKAGGSAKLTINKSTGKITVKKGTKKGTYKIKVKVTAAGNSGYKVGTKNIIVTVRVK